MAESYLKSTKQAEVFTFTFHLVREAFHDSRLLLSTQLYEKNGDPTLGGGVVYQIDLRAFPPTDSSAIELPK